MNLKGQIKWSFQGGAQFLKYYWFSRARIHIIDISRGLAFHFFRCWFFRCWCGQLLAHFVTFHGWHDVIFVDANVVIADTE